VEAIAAERQALNVDPLSIVSTQNLGHLPTFDRQYPEAAIQLERAIELDPARPGPWFGLAWALLLADSTDYARRALERWAALAGADPHHFTRPPALVSQHRRTSVPAPLPEEIYGAPQLSLMDRARSSALVGDIERAFELLEQLVRERWPQAFEVPIDPSVDSVREDPRFGELLNTIR
jgi:tetratricopeptide (TPR) repeat protein